MKRFSILCLLLCLLLCACAGPRTFVSDAEGLGYIDRKSDRLYVQLDPTFEPSNQGEVFGEFVDKESEFKRTFYEIGGLSTEEFLADESLNVYYAGEKEIDPAAWEISKILVCEEDAISVEKLSFERGTDDEVIGAICELWFEGQEALLPVSRPQAALRVKLATEEYPNLTYNFSYYSFADGSAYFYCSFTRRAVALTDELVEAFASVSGAQE